MKMHRIFLTNDDQRQRAVDLLGNWALIQKSKWNDTQFPFCVTVVGGKKAVAKLMLYFPECAISSYGFCSLPEDIIFQGFDLAIFILCILGINTTIVIKRFWNALLRNHQRRT